MFNPKFDRNGLDDFGFHWFQYLAFAFTIIFIILIWLYFRDYNFQKLVQEIFRIFNCSGFDCNGG